MNAEEGLYYCFGCQKSGDAISFVRDTQGLDFIDAVRLLADRAGITLHEDEGGPDRRDRAQLLDAMEQGGRVLPPAPARSSRGRCGAQLPALARLRRRRGPRLPAGLGSR